MESAQKAKNVLVGQQFIGSSEYGRFTIDAQFSNLAELTIRHNTDRTRDFTRLPFSPSAIAPASSPPSVSSSPPASPSSASASLGASSLALQQQQQQQQQASQYYADAGQMMAAMRHKPRMAPKYAAAPAPAYFYDPYTMQAAAAAAAAAAGGHQAAAYGRAFAVQQPYQPVGVDVGQQNAAAAAAVARSFVAAGRQQGVGMPAGTYSIIGATPGVTLYPMRGQPTTFRSSSMHPPPAATLGST